MATFAQQVRSQAAPLSTPNSETIKIAVIYPGEQASDYWRRSVITLEKRLSELNIRYELKRYFSRPNIDLVLQSQQLNEAISWDPDYLIYTLDALRHQSMIERMLLRGRPKLILQNITTPVKDWQQLRPFLYTGFDHEQGTLLLSERMLKTSPSGDYSMLYFTPGYVSQMRGDTFINAAAGFPQRRLASRFYTKGDEEIAYNATLAALKKNPDLNMIFACSTDIALGAIQALNESGKSDTVTLNGWGGGDSEISALLAGDLDLTVMRMNDDSSVAIAEAIKLDISGKATEVPHIYSGDIILIDKQTDETEIQKLKNRAFRYSGEGRLN